MAEAARHADAIGPHQLGIIVVGRIGIVALGIPLSRRRVVEGRIGEQAQAHDAARIAVVGAHRHPGGGPGAVGQPGAWRERLTAESGLHPGVGPLVGEGVRLAVGAADVEKEAEATWVRRLGLIEAGLVDQAQIGPAVVAVEYLDLRVRVGGDDLQEVECAEGLLGHHVPESVVAAAPDDPHVAALDLGGGQRQAAVHVVKIVHLGLGERDCRPPGRQSFVLDMPRPGAGIARGDRQGREGQDGERDGSGCAHEPPLDSGQCGYLRPRSPPTRVCRKLGRGRGSANADRSTVDKASLQCNYWGNFPRGSPWGGTAGTVWFRQDCPGRS